MWGGAPEMLPYFYCCYNYWLSWFLLLFFQGMGGASMGIWCAHGEGRAHFPDPQVKQTVLEGGLAPIRSTPAMMLSLLLL